MRAEDDKDLSRHFTLPRARPRFGLLPQALEPEKPGNPVERLKAASEIASIVSRHYPVLSRDNDEHGVYLKVIVDPGTNLRDFEKLRRELKEVGMVPRLIDTGRDTVVAAYPMLRRRKGKVTANIVMLVLTIITTVWAGAMIWETRTGSVDSFGDLFMLLFDPRALFLGGLTFAFPLLLILGTHELGHYFTSRRYRIDASLPYFIPIPPFISPFGTFGALISMKEPISNRRSLVDIGAAGPIAGFLVAMPVTIIGLMLTDMFPASADLVEGQTYLMINPPLLFHLLAAVVGLDGGSSLFPTALAGWIGLFVTALNLFPVGQLDGGHIARGVLGDKARYLSYATVGVMVFLGIFTSFGTYILFAVLIMLTGSRHPPPLDDISRLSKRQFLTAGFAVLIMAVTFHPVPLESYTYDEAPIDVRSDHPEDFASPYVPDIINVTVDNPGEKAKDIEVSLFINGTRVLPSFTKKDLDLDDAAYSGIMNRSQAVFEHQGWYVIMLDPMEKRVEGASRSYWELAVGCHFNKSYGERAEATLRFKTASGRTRTLDMVLERSGTAVVLDRAENLEDGSCVIDGKVLMFDTMASSTALFMERSGPFSDREVAISLGPADGRWDQNKSAVAEDTLMGEVVWNNDPQGPVSSARFSIIIPPVEGPERMPLRMSVRAFSEPSGNRTAQMTIWP